MKQGFSLIELIIAIGIFAVVTVIVTQAIASSLTGVKKSDSTTKVRENLEFVVSTMERRVRNAKDVICISTTEVEYTTTENETLGFECLDIGSNGYVAQINALGARESLTDDSIDVISCNFVCEDPIDITPGTLSFSISAVDTKGGSNPTQSTVSSQVFLRTY